MSTFKVTESNDYETIKSLFVDYSQIKGAEGCFVSFEKELADLQSFYQGGALFLGFEDETPVACIAIKKINDSTCEIKRLYVKPKRRGKGYSRQMLNAALQRAQKLGFTTATLTTRPSVMPVAFQLYTRSGFENLGEKNGVVRMMEMIMPPFIAYCGLNCEKCEARIATINNDDNLRQKVAKEWSELNHTVITPEMINCTGCRIEGVKTPFCDHLCPIRQCAKSKNIPSCGSCAEMSACQKLAMVTSNNKEAAERVRNYIPA